MVNRFMQLAKMTVFVTALIVIVRCLLFSNEQAYSLYTFAMMVSQSLGVAVPIMLVYVHWLWRYNPLEKTPKLHKSYKGIFTSSYDDKTREATLLIKQNLLNVNIIMQTPESFSESKIAMFTMEDSMIKLIYTYSNTPKTVVDERSKIHNGTVIFNAESPDKLMGRYFTDRKTIGDMEFTVVNKDTPHANQHQRTWL